MADGIANAKDGRAGRESWREYNVVNLEVFEIVGAENRGRKAERTERVVI